MKKWLKGKFRKDRWMILRITHWTYGGREGIRESKIHCKNRYTGKLAVFTLYGEFYVNDFPNETFTK